MAPPNWNDEHELMRDLAEALGPDPLERPDPVEQQVIDAASAVRRWRASDPDLELAALLYDSDLDTSAHVRGSFGGPPRTLVFGCCGWQIEIELNDAGIEGQLIPPEAGTVRLRDVDGASTETTADEVGCFRFPSPHRVPIRIECAVEGQRFATAWIAA